MDLSSDLGEEDGPHNNNNSDGGDDDPLVLSPGEVLSRLERGWMNEKLSPDLLPPLEQEKDAMLAQIKVMERNVDTLDKKDIRTDIHKLELERIKFIVVSYMRSRLFKIQLMCFHLYDVERKRPQHRPSLLLGEEYAFLKSIVSRTEEYFRTTLLSKMPTPLQKFDLKKFKRFPPLDSHVFLRVNEANTLDVEDAHEQVHTVALGEGEQHVMRYQPVSKLVTSGGVYLV